MRRSPANGRGLLKGGQDHITKVVLPDAAPDCGMTRDGNDKGGTPVFRPTPEEFSDMPAYLQSHIMVKVDKVPGVVKVRIISHPYLFPAHQHVFPPRCGRGLKSRAQNIIVRCHFSRTSAHLEFLLPRCYLRTDGWQGRTAMMTKKPLCA